MKQSAKNLGLLLPLAIQTQIDKLKCISIPEKNEPAYIKGIQLDKIRTYCKLEKKFTTFASIQDNKEHFMTYVDFLKSISHYSYHTLKPQDLANIQATHFNKTSNLMKLIDSNNDGRISFSEYLVIAYFINLRLSKIRCMFDELGKNASDKERIEHIWNNFLNSEVQKSINVGNHNMLDARATQVSNSQLREDFDHVMKCVIEKYKKLDSVSFEKVYNMIMEDVFQQDFYFNDDQNHPQISEQTFAKIILKYMPIKDRSNYIIRLKKLKVDEKIMIKQEEYLGFCFFTEKNEEIKEIMFKNDKKISLNDFKKIYYEYATKNKFKQKMTPSMIDLMFRIIDLDNNNELDTVEFDLIVARDVIGLKENDTKSVMKNWYNQLTQSE